MTLRPWMLYNAEGGTSAPPTADPTPAASPPANTGGPGTPPGGQPPAGDGNAPAPNWFDTLDPSLRTSPTLAKFVGKDVGDLAKSYAELSKVLGVAPENLARLDELKAAGLDGLKKLGAPETKDAYEFKAPEGTPEHLASGENLAWFKDLAVEARLLPQQADALYQKFVARNVELQKAADAQVEAATRELKEKHGQAYEGLTKAAGKAADELGIRAELEASGLGAHPKVVEALAKVAKFFGEGETGSPGVGDGKLSPAMAEAKAADLQRQAHQAFRAGDKAKSAELQRQAQKYFKMLD